MPGYGLAPADKLKVTYDFWSRKLKLEAYGEVPAYMYGFKFDRETIYGGLKFSFNAWSEYAFMGEKNLHHCQTYVIPNIQVVGPEMKVVIVDLKHPEGQSIEIEEILHIEARAQGNGATTEKSKALANTSAADSLIPKMIFPDPILMTAVYDEPFIIKRSVLGTKSLEMKHNESSLILETANFESGNLQWIFKSFQTGITEVIVSATSDFLIHDVPAISKYLYIITVIDLLNILPIPPPNEILSFKGRVFIAQRLVGERYKGAQLIDVSVKLPPRTPYPVRDPLRLSHMRCLFIVDDGMVTITSKGWGTFGPPVFSEDTRLGLRQFDIEDLIDITDAAKDMVKAGIEMAFWSCELLQMLVSPVEPDDQPHYIFTMVNDSRANVGAKDGSVEIVPALPKILPGKVEVKKIQNGGT
ncbi:MAG: hypothetical protein Q9190_006023 [Brigantiaea leucoxantha]